MVDFFTKYKSYILFFLLLILIYFPIFLHLTYMPIRMWDESIMANNAIQMGANHNYIVTYFDNNPDTLNCKPPLMIWCIVFFSKILGFSELSLRLPSALAALCLCIYLFVALKKYSGSPVYGFFVVAILVTSQGYIRNHVTRTGEYDSLLVLFSTIFSLQLFFACEAVEKKEQSKHLLGFFIFITLAVLTKGVACIMQAPGLLIYVLLRKKFFPFLKNKWLYAGLAIFIVFGLGYYVLRETLNTGYIQAVWVNELGGRFGGVLDNHQGPFTLYINEMVTWQFIEYMFIFPAALIIGAFFSEPFIRRLVLFAALTGSSFLFVVSSAATKLPHYDAPLFPYLAIITASFFYFVYILIRQKLQPAYQLTIASGIAFIVMLSFFARPYTDIISKVYFPKGDSWEEGFSTSCKYFQDAVRGKVKQENCKLAYDYGGMGEGCVVTCYKEELKERLINTEIVHPDQVKAGDSVIVFDNPAKELIKQKFVTEEIHSLPNYNADVIYIKSEK